MPHPDRPRRTERDASRLIRLIITVIFILLITLGVGYLIGSISLD
jgi:hypothetical protein